MSWSFLHIVPRNLHTRHPNHKTHRFRNSTPHIKLLLHRFGDMFPRCDLLPGFSTLMTMTNKW